MPQTTAAFLRIGLVGAGQMAREHARAFADVSGVRVVGVTSRTRPKAETLAGELGIGRVADDIDELYDACLPDLVVVAVNEPSTVEVMRHCIARQRPILTEKPVGIDERDCRTVRDLSRAAGVPVWVGLNRRCYGATQAALHGLQPDAGARFVEVHDQQDAALARRMGRPEAVVQNWMFANSIHLVDYFSIFGRGTVDAIEVIDRWRDGMSTLVGAQLRFSSGDSGFYRAVWGMPGPWACAVTTTEQRWELRPLEAGRSQRKGSRTAEDVEPDPWDQAFKPGFRRQAEQVVNAVRTGTAPESVPSIDDALATTELVGRIYEKCG